VIDSFKNKALLNLWRTGRSSKIDSRLFAIIRRRLDALNVATKPEDVDFPDFNFHSLTGFDPTRYTVHVNGPWCITFAFADGDAEDVDFGQYH
jgi:proteic killer suppression protein